MKIKIHKYNRIIFYMHIANLKIGDSILTNNYSRSQLMNRKILKRAFSFVFYLLLIISFVSCSTEERNTDDVISTHTQETSHEDEITEAPESDTIASTEKDTTEDMTVIVPVETEITEIRKNLVSFSV